MRNATGNDWTPHPRGRSTRGAAIIESGIRRRCQATKGKTKAVATAKQPAADDENIPTYNLLEAMSQGLVGVEASGRGDGRMTVSVTNNTKKQLRVVLPPGIIAQGATGQFGGMGGGMGGMGGGMGGMGGGMGGMGGGMGGMGGGMGGMGGGMGGMGGGMGGMGGGMAWAAACRPERCRPRWA